MLEVSFNSPQCGWMSIGFAGDREEFHTTTAHTPHERALPELLRILTDLLDDTSTKGEYVLLWNRNPEEFDFRFLRQDKSVRLEIYQYPGETRERTESERVFSHEGKVSDVCQAFYATFAQLYADKDTDEFEFNWRQAFPLEDYANFEKKMKSYG